MKQLDDDLREAAARLRQASEELEVPQVPSPSRRWPVATVLLIVVIALASLAASWSGGRPDKDGTVASGGPEATSEHPLPDGRGVTISMSDTSTAGTSSAEYCGGVGDTALCVSAQREPRVAWSLSASSTACDGGELLLYGITTLTAAESFEYRNAGSAVAVTERVWPRTVAIPQRRAAEIAEQAMTFAACVPGDGTGRLTLYGGYSQDLGRNVTIATNVPRAAVS